MLLDAAYPNDIRVEKEASALIGAGFEVTLFCARRIGEAIHEDVGGLNVVRMSIPSANDQFNKKGWHDIFGAIDFFFRDVFREAKKWSEGLTIDAVHVHDLPLAKTALKLARELNVPCILDLHENYADGLATWTHWQSNPLKRLKNRIFFHPKRWLKYERRMVRAVDFVIVSVLEMEERLLRECEISEAKTLLVSNTEYRGFHDQYPSLSKKEVLPEEHFNITYIGGIGPHRGVDTAIRAMEYVREEIPHARLNIIGPGSPSVLKALSEIVDALQLDEWVKFYGKVPFHHVSSYMMHSDVNIIPHNSNRQTEAAIPHKLFQSMLSGRPTLVSSCAPLRRVIKSCDGGWVFEADNPKACAQQVVSIYSAMPDELMRAERARKASSGPLSWETTGEHLSGFYQNLQS